MKRILVTSALTMTLAFAGVSAFALKPAQEVKKADALVSSTVTRVYIEDQVNSNTTLLAIESISFASGYSHDLWRDFLTSYLGTRSSYNTSSGSTQPSTKGWSYMSDSEQTKYLLCPTGAKNFTMVFPEWVTALSYKAVGNNFWNWFDVNGSAVGLHSGWGIGKKVNSYIYNSGGWTMNANLDNTSQTNSWGDVTITAIGSLDGSELERREITMSKYYLMSSQTYSTNVCTFGGWYTNIGCTSAHSGLVTANATVYAKLTAKTESYLAGTMNGWNTTDPDYLMAPKENNQYMIDVQLDAGTEFKVVYNGNWYGWSQVDQSSSVVVNGYISGSDNISVETTGKYEIYIKTYTGTNMIWIQQDSGSEADTYAQAFLAAITCTSESTTFSINVWNEVSGTDSMEYKFSQLTNGAKNVLKDAVANPNGTNVQKCVARYDRILSKYGSGTGAGQYHNFMGRSIPSSSAKGLISFSSNNSAVLIGMIITIIAVTSAGAYFFLRKKKVTE